MGENKQLITALPQIRQEYGFTHAYTHSLWEMNAWIRDFYEKVRQMAVQRDEAVPDTVSEQIELYKLYLEHHSQGHDDASDREWDECPTLDALDGCEQKEQKEQSDEESESEEEESEE